MRILQINSVCGSGSTGRIAEGIHRLAVARGDSSRIAFGRGSSPADMDAIRIGSRRSVAVHGALSRLTDRHGFYSAGPTKRLLADIDAYEPDIIHLHNLHGYYLDISLLFAHITAIGVPIVWTLHDCWPLTGHCAHFDFVRCDRWMSGCHDCPQKSSYPRTLLFDRSRDNWVDKRRLFAMPDRMEIVAPSEWLASLIAQSHLKERSTRIIRNGVNTSLFRPTVTDFRAAHGLDGKVMILGVAAQWGPRKGLDDFARLARTMQSSTSGLRDHVIVLVGLSPAQMRRMPSSIIAVGPTASPTELAGIYSTADVLFNPTHEDNYPSVNLEALACGTPVVTYDTGGGPESIRPGVDGHVLRSKTVEEFVTWLAAGGLDRLQVGQRDDLSEEASLAEYLQLYDQLLGSEKSTPTRESTTRSAM